MTDRRFRQPLPLGGEDGLPFSKGLMARSLVAAGITADRAYELSLALEADLCLLYTSPSPRDGLLSRMPSSA